VRDCETKAQVKKSLKEAVTTVAERLGNTPAVCRKCYIHPHVINAYLGARGTGEAFLAIREGQPVRGRTRKSTKLEPDEAAVLALLKRQLALEKAQEKNSAAPFEATMKALKKRGEREA
jgi:DNA topoisomerase I